MEVEKVEEREEVEMEYGGMAKKEGVGLEAKQEETVEAEKVEKWEEMETEYGGMAK